MKKTGILLLVTSLTLFFVSCSDDDEKVTYNVTQSALDGVSKFVADFTGGTMAHGGPEGTSPDSTIRDVYSSIASLDGDIPVGTVITKKTYKKDSEGNKSDLYVSFAMVKRESGYYTEGGDWEYIMIPYDESNDYSEHPYGMLPDADTDGRGKLGMCMACHAGANGGDYLFVND